MLLLTLFIRICWLDKRGSLAQLVEQRPEEPCVPSSSLGGATKESTPLSWGFFFVTEFNDFISQIGFINLHIITPLISGVTK